MTARSFMTRLAAIATLTAAVSAGLVPGTASAASESVCNAYYCNETFGSDNRVDYVNAYRGVPILGRTGFFEVFGPGGYKKTGATGVVNGGIPINRTFPRNSFICLRFFENVAGQWIERGSAACTRTPIG